MEDPQQKNAFRYTYPKAAINIVLCNPVIIGLARKSMALVPCVPEGLTLSGPHLVNFYLISSQNVNFFLQFVVSVKGMKKGWICC